MSAMDMNGMNFTGAGTLMNMEELIDLRKKKGQCLTCGRQTHMKKIFKMVPLTVPDEVLDGRCLRCQPLDSHNKGKSFAKVTHQLMAASRASQAFHDTSQAETLSSTLNVMPKQQHALEAATSTSFRNQSMAPVREITSTRSRIDFSSGISQRRLDTTQHETNAISHRGLLHSQELFNKSSRSIPVVSRLDSTDKVESKRSINYSQGMNERPNSNRSITCNASVCSDELDRSSRLSSHQSNSDRSMRDDRKLASGIDQLKISTGREGKHSQTESLITRSNPDQSSSRKNVTSPSRHDTENALQMLAYLTNPTDVIQVMLENPYSSPVQTEACRILASQFPASHSAMLLCDEQKGLFRAILDAFKNHPNEEAVHEIAHKLLCLISVVEEEEIVAFQFHGGMEIILASLRDFPENEKLQLNGFTTLSKLSLLDCIQTDIVKYDGISVLVCGMTTHSLDAAVQEMACRTLLNLSSTDVNVKEAVSTGGGIDSISIAMVMHPTALNIQELGCRALCQLSANSEENKVKIEEAGGIDAILTAMLVHRGETNLQKEACWALSNLAINSNNKLVIGESNGVEVILKIMHVHKSDAALQELACRALWTLSIATQNKDLIAQGGGIQAVITAMQDHTEYAGVQEKGCGCLANLAANSEENKRLIIEEEGIDVIVLAMVLHPEERIVQEKAVNCLRKLACEPYLDALRASGVVSLVEQAAENFPSNCRVVADQVLQLLL